MCSSLAGDGVVDIDMLLRAGGGEAEIEAGGEAGGEGTEPGGALYGLATGQPRWLAFGVAMDAKSPTEAAGPRLLADPSALGPLRKVLGEGTAFGDRALLSDPGSGARLRKSTAVALEPTELLVLDAAAFVRGVNMLRNTDTLNADLMRQLLSKPSTTRTDLRAMVKMVRFTSFFQAIPRQVTVASVSIHRGVSIDR